jgi:hypothetical protein
MMPEYIATFVIVSAPVLLCAVALDTVRNNLTTNKK